MQIHVLKKVTFHKRKYENLCIVAFNRKFHYDDVIQMKNKIHTTRRELSQL